jgi:hypothetical protein
MMARLATEKFLPSILSALLVSCSTTRSTTAAEVKELSRYVLIIQESPSGQVTHDWRHAEEIDLSPYKHQSNSRRVASRIMLVSRVQRECEQELIDCHRDCMKRPVPPDYNQYEHNRGLGGRADYCNRQCLQPYLECKELEKLRPQEFSAVDSAVDWLKRNRKEVLLGSVVIVAGVAFVVISAGAGVLVLAPALLAAS